MSQVPSAAGYPTGGSAASSAYTPQIYAKELLIKFYAKTVFGEIAHRKYEGEIKNMGDKVIIRTIPDVNVYDYEKGMDLTSKRQTPESNAVEVYIDKAKGYSVGIDDIDKLQQDINNLDAWARDGSEQLGIQIDRSILNAIYADADTYNKGATAGKVSGGWNLGASGAAVSIDRSNVLDYISDCASVLTENDVPLNDRWFVIPEWMANLINKSDLRNASMSGDSSNQALRNGKMGELNGFTLYTSNNYVSVSDTYTCWNVLFGQKNALTFASQLVKNRVLELQNTWGTVMEGLHVYGYKVVKSQALGLLYCYKGT